VTDAGPARRIALAGAAVAWTGLILWVAVQPETRFLPPETREVLGLPRNALQYPYHAAVFFVLSVLVWRTLLAWGFARRARLALTLAGCLAVAIASEAVQVGVPSRGPSVQDVTLDLGGAVLALACSRDRRGAGPR
jgi:VanZ family protein